MAQSTSNEDSRLTLSLQEAIEIALEQNFSTAQAEFDVDKTRAQFRQTNAVFLPQLSFEYNAISTNDPLNVFGFKLKQEVVSQQDFNPALLNKDPLLCSSEILLYFDKTPSHWPKECSAYRLIFSSYHYYSRPISFLNVSS